MKKIITSIAITLLISCNVQAQDTMYVHQDGGWVTKIAVSKIDSVVFYSSANAPGNVTATDMDGNVYESVVIGPQVWMTENLKATKYSDGTPIELVNDAISWMNTTTGAYCWYTFDIGYKTPYGALYNYYTIDSAYNGNKNVCPTGWHVPSNSDWIILAVYLGDIFIAGGKLKEAGTAHWKDPNVGADNSSGFTCVPGGFRVASFGTFYQMGEAALLWCSDKGSGQSAMARIIYYSMTSFSTSDQGKNDGFSIRCLKD